MLNRAQLMLFIKFAPMANRGNIFTPLSRSQSASVSDFISFLSFFDSQTIIFLQNTKTQVFQSTKSSDVLIVETCNQCMNSCCIICKSIAVSSKYAKHLGKDYYMNVIDCHITIQWLQIWFAHCQISLQVLGQMQKNWVAPLFPV